MGTKNSIKNYRYGLIGKDLHHSFSQSYFHEKFQKEALHNYTYDNLSIESEQVLAYFFKSEVFQFQGLNVTIPYKTSILHFMDELSPEVQKINAANVINIKKDKIFAHNTDYVAFQESILPFIQKHHREALILGTGGAAQAVKYALSQIGIAAKFVSRDSKTNAFTYVKLDKQIMQEHQIIVNCTPLGTTPNILTFPDIPYHLLNPSYLVYDLVYNPSTTLFLQKAQEQGAQIKNGLEMLHLQAQKSWEIWNL